MKQVVVRPAAAADIEDAYRYPVLHRDTRRALIPQRFPYGLFYRIYGDVIASCAAQR